MPYGKTLIWSVSGNTRWEGEEMSIKELIKFTAGGIISA